MVIIAGNIRIRTAIEPIGQFRRQSGRCCMGMQPLTPRCVGMGLGRKRNRRIAFRKLRICGGDVFQQNPP